MGKLHYGWVLVAAGGLVTCIAAGAMFALPVYLQAVASETGWSRAAISTSMTIGFVAMGVGGFGWGALSDSIGARPVVLMASLLLSAGLAIASRATDVLIFQLAYGLLVGGSGGAFFAPLIAATTTWFEKNRSLAVSLVSVGGGAGPMVMSPLAAVLIGQYGWRMTMLAIAIFALVTLVPLTFLIRAREEGTDQASPGAAIPQSVPMEARQALASPEFAILATTFFLCCAAHSGPIFHTVAYAMMCGLPALAAVSIYSIEGLAGLFGRLVFGLAADRFGVKPVIIIGLLIQAVGIASYTRVREIGEFYMMASVLGLAYGGVMPLYAVLAREYFSQRIMGTVLGAATMTSAIGMAFGPLAGGWLFDHYGDYSWLYIGSGAVGLGAVLVAIGFPRPGSRVANA